MQQIRLHRRTNACEYSYSYGLKWKSMKKSNHKISISLHTLHGHLVDIHQTFRLQPSQTVVVYKSIFIPDRFTCCRLANTKPKMNCTKSRRIAIHAMRSVHCCRANVWLSCWFSPSAVCLCAHRHKSPSYNSKCSVAKDSPPSVAVSMRCFFWLTFKQLVELHLSNVNRDAVSTGHTEKWRFTCNADKFAMTNHRDRSCLLECAVYFSTFLSFLLTFEARFGAHFCQNTL